MIAWRFRPLARADFPLLARWLRTPHVARWWADDASPAALEADYGGCIDGTEPAVVAVAERAGHPLGLVQHYRIHAYPEYVRELAPVVAVPPEARSIDYLLGEAAVLRQGVGSAMLAAWTRTVWAADPDCRSILVPVHAENRASWRVLERSGYSRIAAGELAPDNPADSRQHFIYRALRPCD